MKKLLLLVCAVFCLASTVGCDVKEEASMLVSFSIQIDPQNAADAKKVTDYVISKGVRIGNSIKVTIDGPMDTDLLKKAVAAEVAAFSAKVNRAELKVLAPNATMIYYIASASVGSTQIARLEYEM